MTRPSHAAPRSHTTPAAPAAPAALAALALAALGGVLAIGCGASRGPTVTGAPHASGLDCELVVGREGDRLTLAFSLVNHSPQPVTVHYFRPFMELALRALAEGRELPIMQPDFDAPVQPAELQVPAGGRGTLDTPVRLQFSPRREAGDDPFVWTIVGEPAAIELHATLRLEGLALPACVTRVDLAGGTPPRPR